jgi:hypothetical protein
MTIKELKKLILVGVETEINILNDNNLNFWKKYKNTVDFDLDETIDDLKISEERFKSIIIYENGITIYVD